MEQEAFIQKKNVQNTEQVQTLKKQPYLTRDETASLLKINLSTLWRWSKQNYFPSYGIGGKVYYKLEDIDNAMIKLN